MIFNIKNLWKYNKLTSLLTDYWDKVSIHSTTGDITTVGDLNSVDLTTTGNATLPAIYTDSIDNTSGDGSAKLTFGLTGLLASRNKNDGNAVYTIQQLHASATGNYLNIKDSTGAIVWDVRKDGITDMVNNLNIFSNSADALANGLNFGKSRGTFDTPTIVSANDVLGEVNFTGHDGTNYIDAAQIRAIATGTPGTDRVGGQLEFWVHPDSTSAMAKAAYISNGKHLFLNGNLYAYADILGYSRIFMSKNALETTTFDSIQAKNTTAALVGTPVQVSPASYKMGTAWNSNAGVLASEDVEMRSYLIPISGDGVTGKMTYEFQIDGGGYATAMYLYNNGTLDIKGGLFTSLVEKTADYTATSADSVIVADGSSAAVTITLPTAVGIEGREYKIKCIDSTNTVTVDGNGTETIDGALTKTLVQWDCLHIVSDGSDWIVL